ncbi:MULTISPECIES: hypothetical protein [Gordonia]|uniref:Lipoprotein n=1 Tax=Gordonia amicalis TaxID=89053 RepID=A0AAE4U4A9_9ACTN|nr:MULTISPECIES: hypothetical protein [Gordonia]ATD70092.1 hypothetical protein CNO18_07235 [Gordonia sp. 1D]MCZ4581658.1 hypothetical protein [Gordonia amicalis]MDJ0455191.1 hypothetical protein [Gordonia amicalis]MDV6306893.1 hypothetical protein [Gordonia amicalis]MDV6311085.1 hypothetical protein [Gordonia amicalis]
MRRHLVRTRGVGALIVVSATALLISGCAGGQPPAATSTSVAPTPTARPIDPAKCAEKPLQGNVDRGGHGLDFRSGDIRIAITEQAATTAGLPAAGNRETSEEATTCYEFARWGPARPDVPPDSLLFVFKGTGTDGAQIEFPVSELTGGTVPPAGGGPRPTAGPLTTPINAQIGVSVDGVYHQSSACRLSISGMSGKLAAGSFTCPEAARVDANPFAPDDDVAYDTDESSTSRRPDAGTPSTVVLSGRFQVTP